ncbi:MAG: hypothetical protein FWC40_02870 [Proteobacteria bacterium]|nr:hypothetical protein [Pseudomonadota bacterium]
MKPFVCAALTAIFLGSMASSTMAQNVTLNGVDITGIRGQHFTNVDIAFDDKGNLAISAPQYKVAPLPAVTPQAPAATPQVGQSPSESPSRPSATLPETQSPIYLVALFSAPGLLGYNIDVYINGQFVKTLTQGQAQQTIDVTAHLRKGANLIQYRPVLAADSGKSSRASVELLFSIVSQTTSNAIELTGAYAATTLTDINDRSNYNVELILP